MEAHKSSSNIYPRFKGLQNRFTTTQITCIQFIGPYLLTGDGSWLHIYRISHQQEASYILKFRVFEKSNVYGITEKPEEGNLHKTVCVFGGKSIRILLLNLTQDPINLTAKSPAITFQDWIWDVRWLCTDEVAIILAQNYVIIFNSLRNHKRKVAQCEEKCILYCAYSVGGDWPTLAIFSGTVFQEILIWCPNGADKSKNDMCKILHRLKGHDGVIFSVVYNAKFRKLCSSSDDRSVQIWQHELPELAHDAGGNLTECLWQNSSFVCLFRLYGHEARVWKVTIAQGFYISAGEDSLVCIWMHDESKSTSELVKKVLCHSGSSIRSLCLNKEESLMATGGEDGGIKLWPLPNSSDQMRHLIHSIKLNQINEKLHQSAFQPGDYPKELHLVDKSRILVMTNDGFLFCYDMTYDFASLCINDANYKSYSVIDTVERENSSLIICIGDITGTISFLSTTKARTKDNRTEFTALGTKEFCSGRIFALKWIAPNQLLACGPSGRLVLFQVNTDGGTLNVILCLTYVLPICKQRWFTTAALVADRKLLLCGCRDGSIHVYSTDSTDFSQENPPLQTLPRLHGSNGVTSFLCEKAGIVYSTGRDGFLRILKINKKGLLTELNKSWISSCPKWICGVTRSSDKHLLIYGFYTDTFIVWNEHDQSSLLEISCGGGHRSWDFQINETEATYAFLKEKEIRFCRVNLQTNKPLCVKPGLHIRQTCHVRHLLTDRNRNFCLTVSEDTTLQILEYSQSDVKLRHVLKGHISSVKSTAACIFKPQKCSKRMLLVSVGGRAQMLVWILKLTKDLPGSSAYGVQPFQVQQMTSHMLNPTERRLPVPWHEQSFTVDPETRYMDVVVWNIKMNEAQVRQSLYIIATACSDSYLRLFYLNTDVSKVHLLLEDPLHKHCILKISYFRTNDISDRAVLITAATDGKVIFWDVTSAEDFVRNCGKSETNTDQSKPAITVITSMQLHQSSITALAVFHESASSEGQRLILATGGDDTAIHVRWLQLEVLESHNSEPTLLRIIENVQANLPVAHSAQITGIHFLSSRHLVTASVDQRISIWQLNPSPDSATFEIKLAFSQLSNVADVSCITSWPENDDAHCICAAGKGIEFFEAFL